MAGQRKADPCAARQQDLDRVRELTRYPADKGGLGGGRGAGTGGPTAAQFSGFAPL